VEFSGGVEGYTSLTSYRLVYLGEEVRSGVLEYVRLVTAVALLAVPLLLLSVPLMRRNRDLGLALASPPPLLALTLRGLVDVVRREVEALTYSNLSTTAGLVVFPPRRVVPGPAEPLIRVLLLLAFAEVVAAVALYLEYSRRPEVTAGS